MLRTVWHPAPRHDLIHTVHGNIRVLTGPMRGQLKTAEFIEL
jgi:hypothetical protein